MMDLTYGKLLEHDGWTVAAFCHSGEYQGTHAVLLRRPVPDQRAPEWAFLEIEHGSCSDCDALEAAVRYGENGADEIRSSIMGDVIAQGYWINVFEAIKAHAPAHDTSKTNWAAFVLSCDAMMGEFGD